MNIFCEALVQVLAWHETGNKPVRKSTITKFTDANKHHQGAVSI